MINMYRDTHYHNPYLDGYNKELLLNNLSRGIEACILAKWGTVGVDMAVEKSVIQAMEACKIDASFLEVKWPAPMIRMQFEGKERKDLWIARGNYKEMMEEGTRLARWSGDKHQLDGIETMKSLYEHPSSVEWSDDTILYSIQNVSERGNINGHFASSTTGENLISDLHKASIHDDPDPENSARVIFDHVMLALKVMSYASNEYFRPTPVRKDNVKLRKKLKNKGFDVRKKGSLQRVVYLPKIVREACSKSKSYTPTKPLQNGRIGFLRQLRSDYFVNKQGQSVLIPPLPDKNGRFPKVLYKVKDIKDLAA
jgi:hypothetical protein